MKELISAEAIEKNIFLIRGLDILSPVYGHRFMGMLSFEKRML